MPVEDEAPCGGAAGEPRCGGAGARAAAGAAVPLDAGGFCVSFPADDREGVASFLDEYGFVVVRDALTGGECDATLRELWQTGGVAGWEASLPGRPAPPDPERPETWGPFFEKQRFGFAGIVGMQAALTPQQLANRQSAGVHAAFAAVHGTPQLWVDHDRLGLMPPTVGVDTGDGPRDRPEWRTKANWLHLDCNPCSTDGGSVGLASIASFRDSGEAIDFSRTLIIQGLLALTDAREEDGGFHCVPASHRESVAWARANRCHGTGNNMQVPPSDPLHELIRRVPVRRGCLLAWSSLLFHGNHPNHSRRFRAVQYIRAMPVVGTPYTPLFTSPGDLPDGVDITPLGARLFGFEAWESDSGREGAARTAAE